MDHDCRTTVQTLHAKGVSRKEIARLVGIDVKTVRKILHGATDQPQEQRTDAIVVEQKLVEQLYQDCRGYVQRMHEILTEEHHIDIGYSTLTRLVRSMGLGVTPRERAGHVPDVPGEEMQHDTSTHKIRIGSTTQKVISSGLYLRYSKMRYVRFYRHFNRFVMKCFIDEALRHWGYCARICIVDNTNVIILHGSGSCAVFCPETAGFAQNYGFEWKAHAIGHANRKAGKERNFWTMETNFIPGRRFSSFEDLNRQAFDWATVRYAARPQSRTKLIPLALFDTEKTSLLKLPDFINPPYRALQRVVDQYGYISFDGNFYWIPETVSATTVDVLQYASYLRILAGTREVVRHDIAPDGVKNERIIPPGVRVQPRGVPHNRKLGCELEEQRLRTLGGCVGSYLDMVQSSQGGVRQRPAFIRKLYILSRQWGTSLFLNALQRAYDYQVYDAHALQRIAAQIVNIDTGERIAQNVETQDEYHDRPAYREGQFSEENDSDYSLLS